MKKRHGTVMISVMTNDEDIVAEEWVTQIEAIHRLQYAIKRIRERAAPQFDPSFGEQAPALLGASEEEAAQTHASMS